MCPTPVTVRGFFRKNSILQWQISHLPLTLCITLILLTPILYDWIKQPIESNANTYRTHSTIKLSFPFKSDTLGRWGVFIGRQRSLNHSTLGKGKKDAASLASWNYAQVKLQVLPRRVVNLRPYYSHVPNNNKTSTLSKTSKVSAHSVGNSISFGTFPPH